MKENKSDGIFIWSCHRSGTRGYRGGFEVKTFFPEIQPDLVCEYYKSNMNGTYNSTILGSPSPVALGRCQKVKYH